MATPVPTSKSIHPSNLNHPNLLSRFKSENWEDVSAPAISKLHIAAASNRPQETWHIFLPSHWEKFSWAISPKIFYYVMATRPKRRDIYFSFLNERNSHEPYLQKYFPKTNKSWIFNEIDEKGSSYSVIVKFCETKTQNWRENHWHLMCMIARLFCCLCFAQQKQTKLQFRVTLQWVFCHC